MVKNKNWATETEKIPNQDPQTLLQTVYFLNGKHFALRSRDEHRNLRAGVSAQIKVMGMGADQYIQYTEDMSKNNSGGIKDAKYTPKTGSIFPTGGPNCPVAIISLYISRIPKNSAAFYCRANEASSKFWFRNQPLGENALAKIVPSFAAKAGWDTTLLWSGHSLRASCITALYDAGFADSTVMKVSGHRSDNALREYQRSDKRKRKTSLILSRPAMEAVNDDTIDDDDFDSDSTLEFGLVEIGDEIERSEKIRKINSISNNVFNNCTINFN